MLILLDLDGVLADFDQGFLAAWASRHPDRPRVPWAARTCFHLVDDCPAPWRDDARAITHSPGFIASLPPVEGALDAYGELARLGQDVRICTSPLRAFEHNVLEKFEWVARHLGRQATERIIMTRDKTLVAADLLIDDRPHIAGARTPLWRHIVFAAPYNAHVSDRPRMTWQNWRSVLAGEMYRNDE